VLLLPTSCWHCQFTAAAAAAAGRRRFWQQLLGGITVLDLAVLCFIAAVNIVWTCALLTHNWRLLLPQAALQGYAAPTNVGAWQQHGRG
jgi:hypothetical protein